jgi:hypothetical protein
MLVILATQEAEIRRILVQSLPGQIVCKILSQKTLSQKIALVEWLKVKARTSSPSSEKQKKIFEIGNLSFVCKQPKATNAWGAVSHTRGNEVEVILQLILICYFRISPISCNSYHSEIICLLNKNKQHE